MSYTPVTTADSFFLIVLKGLTCLMQVSALRLLNLGPLHNYTLSRRPHKLPKMIGQFLSIQIKQSRGLLYKSFGILCTLQSQQTVVLGPGNKEMLTMAFETHATHSMNPQELSGFGISQCVQ